MSKPKNRQALVELEYCFDKYFKQNFAPVIKSEFERFRRNAEEETAHRQGGGMDAYIDAASPFTTTYIAQTAGPWNRKTTKDLLVSCNEKFFSDSKVSGDIKMMTDAWRATIVSEIGKDKYIELSSGVPDGDLANYYVRNRFETLFLEDLAQKKMPRNTLDYIFKTGFEESLLGFLTPNVSRTCDLDDKVKNLSEKFYNPSVSERIGSFGLSFLLDTASTFGYGSTTKAATWLAVDGGTRLLSSALPSEYSFDVMLGEAIWDDRNAVTNLRVAGVRVQPGRSEYATSINSVLNRQMFRPQFNDQKYKEIAKALRDSFTNSGTGYDHVAEGIRAGLTATGFKLSSKLPFPKWMESKTDSELFTYATSFSAMAMHLRSIGAKEHVLNGKKVTPEELAQKGYDYARALHASVRRQQGLSPEEIITTEDVALEEPSGSPAVSSGLPEVPDYTSQLTDQINAHYAIEEHFCTQGVPPENQATVPGAPLDSPQGGKPAVGGWGGLLDQFGLGDFGTVGKNLGYVIAMLPDLLIGMFTGKTRNLKIDDNLLPIGSIVAGLFVKNPLLKMLLIGFGGANLLNKAGHEALDIRNGSRQPVRLYREYNDEVLDSRIKQPEIRGNSLIATIDNVPSVITINDEVITAYERGMIPLNTLANAVLRRYDEQKTALEETYDREAVRDDIVERSRGLK